MTYEIPLPNTRLLTPQNCHTKSNLESVCASKFLGVKGLFTSDDDCHGREYLYSHQHWNHRAEKGTRDWGVERKRQGCSVLVPPDLTGSRSSSIVGDISF